MKKNALYLLILLLSYTHSKAQIPVGDPSWQLTVQDNFDSLKASLWHSGYDWGNTNNGDEYNDAGNILFNHTAGFMSLKAEKLVTPVFYNNRNYYYKSGTITSLTKYKYGYYEISAKLPKGLGYWPAFWVFRTDGPGSGFGPCTNVGYWNEIDMLENFGLVSQYDQAGGGYIWLDPDSCQVGLFRPKIAPHILNVPGNIQDEHKYAVFWEPSKITWYYDNVPIYTAIDTVYVPHNDCGVIINFAIDPWWVPDANTVFPAYFEVNHFKLWQLQSACSTVETFCSTAFNPATYTYAVKKSVSIGGSGCASPSTINTSSNVDVWATDFILLGEGTTINANGSGTFTIQTTDCPN